MIGAHAVVHARQDGRVALGVRVVTRLNDRQHRRVTLLVQKLAQLYEFFILLHHLVHSAIGVGLMLHSVRVQRQFSRVVDHEVVFELCLERAQSFQLVCAEHYVIALRVELDDFFALQFISKLWHEQVVEAGGHLPARCTGTLLLQFSLAPHKVLDGAVRRARYGTQRAVSVDVEGVISSLYSTVHFC